MADALFVFDSFKIKRTKKSDIQRKIVSLHPILSNIMSNLLIVSELNLLWQKN